MLKAERKMDRGRLIRGGLEKRDREKGSVVVVMVVKGEKDFFLNSRLLDDGIKPYFIH